ncbi:hypothetical protein HA402_011163 [Bradysia odoriphaga]|nr:hypothetical protein HA402_011163 [Bradysia odoriphaga]
MTSKEQYKNSLPAEAFEKLFTNDTADVHFVFEQGGAVQQIPAHKSLLSALSSVFDTMFNGNWEDNKEIVITDAGAAAFQEFLQFFYKGTVELTEDNAHEVLYLANKYYVHQAMCTCASFLIDRLSLKNVLRTLEMADLCDFDELQEKCEVFIGRNIEKISKSKEFLQCNVTMLANIMVIDSLECDGENIFDACIAWATNACEMKSIDSTDVKNLRRELGDCFNLIGFIGMGKKEFAARYRIYKDMFTRNEVDNIFLEFLDNY